MLKEEIGIPKGLDVKYEDEMLTIKGSRGDAVRKLKNPHVKLGISGESITLTSQTERKKVKAIIGTWGAIIRNMCAGVETGWKGELKLVYSHFPVKLKTEGNDLVIENFLGERNSRKVPIPEDIKVEIKESNIIVHGNDKQKVGQMCATIEQATKIRGYDKRVFQDGIYITRKPYLEVEDEGRAAETQE